MKPNLLLWAAALLSVLMPRSSDCRPPVAPSGRHLLLLPRPLLLRLGEQFSLRLGAGAAPDGPSSSSAPQRPLQVQEEKRSDEPPISLDLTFHLLREVLEMARAEQIAQQADNNRKLMDDLGK